MAGVKGPFRADECAFLCVITMQEEKLLGFSCIVEAHINLQAQ